MITELGRLVANGLLGFPRGTNPSSYTQLSVAFFLSAILHFSGDFAYEKRIPSRSFKFFLLQPAVIAFEDFVIYISKRLLRRGERSKNLGRWWLCGLWVINYCWVTLWVIAG